MKADIDMLKKKLEFVNSYDKKINIMEVCGTHTMSIGRHGIRNLLSDNIDLISGPGCPVCVTADNYVDYLYDLALNKNMMIATYGDMFRVPGSTRDVSLEKAKARGADVRMVYSSLDAVRLAFENQDKRLVFPGIGFETTAPATAIAIKEAVKLGLNNFYVLSMHKLVQPVMEVLIKDEELRIDGFLCPGHVAVIVGEDGFAFLEEYDCVSTIAGFEMEEVINGLYSIVESIVNKDYAVKNVYKSLVRKEGNLTAQAIIKSVFEVKDDYWRGLGIIKSSGLKLKDEYRKYDIESLVPISTDGFNRSHNGCQCGEVLKGKLKPEQCRLFGKVCNPESPVGPCMVSGEGSCAASYKYGFGNTNF